jgi:hypothetical protein
MWSPCGGGARRSGCQRCAALLQASSGKARHPRACARAQAREACHRPRLLQSPRRRGAQAARLRGRAARRMAFVEREAPRMVARVAGKGKGTRQEGVVGADLEAQRGARGHAAEHRVQ